MKENFKTIQFFGLPGSGKSYLARKRVKEEGYVLIKKYTKFELYALSLLFMILRPVVSIEITVLLYKENKHNKKLFRYKFRLLMRAMSLQVKSIFRKKAVIDEGFCQFALTLFERKMGEKDLVIFKKLIPKNTKIIIVESDERVRMERLRKRRKIPRVGFGETYTDFISSIWVHNARITGSYLRNNFYTETIFN